MAKPGDRILIASGNCPEHVEILFAAWAAGLVAVPVNAKLHVEEIAAIVHDCDPALCFASGKLAQSLNGRLAANRTITIASTGYEALLGHGEAEPRTCKAADLAWLFYTSGTTGKSKGAMLSHGNLMAMAEAHWRDIDDPQSGTHLLHAAPMSHGSGLYILPYLARGAAQVIPESGSFDPGEVVELCSSDNGTAMFLAPTMVKRLREYCQKAGKVPDGLRLIVYGGGPMYLTEIKVSLALFGPKLAHIYGQGETPMTISGLNASAHIDAEDSILSSVGRARSGVELRVLDEDGDALPAGEMGQIACRSATVMKGYWNMPDATADALRSGWLLTGDVGFLDAGGYLTLTDRTKDLIISGGSNIYPREVEEVLLSHPLVIEASVVGVPDPEWGEVVVAHIVAAQDDDLAPNALDLHCLEHIARFKRPKRYVFHKELPKNAYGKVLKRSLRDAPA